VVFGSLPAPGKEGCLAAGSRKMEQLLLLSPSSHPPQNLPIPSFTAITTKNTHTKHTTNTHLTVHSAPHLGRQASSVPRLRAAPISHRNQHRLHIPRRRPIPPVQRKHQLVRPIRRAVRALQRQAAAERGGCNGLALERLGECEVPVGAVGEAPDQALVAVHSSPQLDGALGGLAWGWGFGVV